MKFIPVDELPIQKRHSSVKRNGDHLREFLNMNVKYAKMDISELDYITPLFSVYVHQNHREVSWTTRQR